MSSTATRTHSDVSLRVVTDHMRTSVMLIGDGVTPGNEGRGYVLRRIMRRAIRNMRLLGATGPVVQDLIDTVIEHDGPAVPRAGHRPRAHREGRRRRGERLPQDAEGRHQHPRHRRHRDQGRPAARSSPGDKAFLLHDTWGFPIDLTLEMAAEQGLSVDEDGFRRLMKEQRERAKADAQAKKTGHAGTGAYREIADKAGETDFIGYTDTESESTIVGILVDGASSPAATEGDEVEIVLDRTPFYAEGGGQIGDTGRIKVDTGAVIEIRDCQKPVPGVYVHKGVVQVGEVTVGAKAQASIDQRRRKAIARAHSATHLTHQALRDALGPTAAQAGSENQPGRFRFDFGSPSAVPTAVMTDVEQKINEVLARDLDVRADVMGIDEAKKQGAIAEFGEKYGERVRVVTIGDFSKELCGGTHVHNTAQLGLVKLLGESSIGSGVRRIEALVGVDAYNFLAREHTVVAQLTELIKGRPEELPEKVSAMLGKLKDAEKEIEKFRAEKVLQAAAGLAESAKDVRGVAVVTGQVPDGTTPDDLRRLVLDVRGRIQGGRPAVVALFTVNNGKPLTVIATNDAARERGLKAGDLVRTAAKTLGGGGGGKPDVAQGGGQNPAAIGEAVDAVERLVAETAKSAAEEHAQRPSTRDRRRGRPDRGRLVRPRRDPRHPGRDGPRPGRPRSSPPAASSSSRSTSRSRSSSASLAPSRGARARPRSKVRGFAQELAKGIAPVPVRLVDERMTTVTASQGLRASGVKAKKGRSRHRPGRRCDHPPAGPGIRTGVR